ncbi:hypothetical protein BT67DRAFT_385630 [Trichocladium antarcticum]|uniref:Inner kinetochore subunit AME1 domain-containing protein n=1 Tax=Trichocladium antarcticum TaxID=1450529 RepID=A0AAN6UGR6_9PEZI|nr:hypothetical protein BT67DRAFT_385630 [Trichocladium antarcticum]
MEDRPPPPDDDHIPDAPMADAPPLSQPPKQPRGALSSVISATKHLSFHSSPTQQEEVAESPVDAPGSGRRRPLRLGAGTPVVGSSALLHRVLEDLDDTTAAQALPGNSSPTERRVATRRSGELRRARMSVESAGSAGSSVGVRRVSVRLSGGSSVAETEGAREVSHFEAVELEVVRELVEGEELEAVEELVDGEVEGVDDVEDLVAEPGDDGEAEEVVGEENEQEPDEAQEVGETEAARRLGRKRPRRSPRGPSPELSSGLVEESPAVKRRRRREPASPAQQQQPAKKARLGRPPSKSQAQPQPEPRPQTLSKPKPKPKPKKQPKKKTKATSEEDGEADSGSVPVTVQRFTKPRRAGDRTEGGEEAGDDLLNGEIPFANRGGVNAVDVLSKLCEELVEAYMAKLEERLGAAEDAAARREQKTMYRALEAFQEELRTRLLEHTIALDTLYGLRKRVRVAQKEKLALRDEILRVRAEREQVALRMDAIRIRHEAESKEALRHISLSSAMHDIDLAVEKGQAAPELSPAEQKTADLASLELLISRVADQACTRSDGGGALRQIREFNAFLERAAGVLEGR